jgi:hypothetical protein
MRGWEPVHLSTQALDLRRQARADLPRHPFRLHPRSATRGSRALKAIRIPHLDRRLLMRGQGPVHLPTQALDLRRQALETRVDLPRHLFRLYPERSQVPPRVLRIPHLKRRLRMPDREPVHLPTQVLDLRRQALQARVDFPRDPFRLPPGRF